jgi:hypothetical protein
VQPIETRSEHRAADIARNVDRFSVIENRQVLMDVKDGAFGRVAADAVDRLAGRHLAARSGRQRERRDSDGCSK